MLAGSKVYRMWSSIHPKEKPNIVVSVEDEEVRRGRPLDYDCVGWGREVGANVWGTAKTGWNRAARLPVADLLPPRAAERERA